jgi:hypothetical protein
VVLLIVGLGVAAWCTYILVDRRWIASDEERERLTAHSWSEVQAVRLDGDWDTRFRDNRRVVLWYLAPRLLPLAAVCLLIGGLTIR